MVTKESLLARRAQIETDLAQQQELARQAEAQRQDSIAKLGACRDMINALSGAKQDVDFWLAQYPADPPAAPSATNVEGSDGGPVPAPIKESLN